MQHFIVQVYKIYMILIIETKCCYGILIKLLNMVILNNKWIWFHMSINWWRNKFILFSLKCKKWLLITFWIMDNRCFSKWNSALSFMFKSIISLFGRSICISISTCILSRRMSAIGISLTFDSWSTNEPLLIE